MPAIIQIVVLAPLHSWKHYGRKEDNISCDGHGMAAQFADLVGEFQERFGRIPAVLDWRSGIQLSALLPHCKIFHPRPNDGPLPYLDGSVDLIVTNANDPSAVSEAWR